MAEIYLDYNASTPVDPRVAAAMRPHLSAAFGNPSSLHWSGRPARNAVELARSRPKTEAIVVCLSGRGEKDAAEIARLKAAGA